MKKLILSSLWILILWIWVFIWEKNIWENKTNIEEIKKSIVVIKPKEKLIEYNKNPEWLFKNKEYWWIGSGFFVSKDWKIITAKHIVPNTDTLYEITIQNKQTYDAKVIYQYKEADIALLKIDTKEKITPLPIAKKINKWEQILSFWTDKSTQEIIHHYGQIIDTNKKWETLSHLIEISSPLAQWFSWWPVINKKWEVIWINYALYKWQSLIQPLESLQ